MSQQAIAQGVKLRIGVLCSGDKLAAWQNQCLSEIAQLDFAEIVIFINETKSQVQRPPIWRRLRSKLASGLLLWRIYERMVIGRKSQASKLVPLSAELMDVPTLEVEPLGIGKFRQAFPCDTLETLKGLELDVLLRFGFGILTGEILSIAKFGIWSFHHGDPEHFRGAPPGFWEIHNQAPVTGVILQRLTETLDGGVVLHSGWFKTQPASYPRSLDRVLFGAAHFVACALKDLRRNPNEIMTRRSLQVSGPIYRYPKTAAMLRFFWNSVAAKIRNQYRSLFRHQQWSVGVVNETPEGIFSALAGGERHVEGVSWLPEPRNAFLADPFLVQISGETMIIAEEFDWKKGLGRISTVPLPTNGEAAPKLAVESVHHLSYPYIINNDAETYCVPECAERNAVSLHRLVQNEDRWIEHKTIIDNFPAIDPTIFSYEGRWWLFCTSAEAGANEVLYAWFADELFGQWQAHPNNPLKVDIRSARPAGSPFMFSGTLIRPAQDCSRAYGGAITFNRIVKLTPDEFREEPSGQLLPERKRYRNGLHTISGVGSEAIVDGARLAFVPSAFFRAAYEKIARVRR